MSNAESRNLKVGIIGSLAVHLLAVLTFACWVAFAPAPEKPPHKDETPEAMVMAQDIEVLPALPPLPEPTPAPPKPKQKPTRYVDTPDNEKDETAPKDAEMISDRNTKAAITKAPTVTGDDAVPTADGVKVKTFDLANREYKPGEIKEERANPVPPTPPPAPVAQPKPVTPPPPPPTPPPQPEKMAKKDDSSAEKMMKELDEALQKDAKDQKVVEIRKAEEPKPKIPALKLPEEAPVPTQSAPPMPPPTPPSLKRTDKDEFVPQRRTSESKGRVTNIGSQNSVDAIETAEGRYVKQVKAAINERWSFHTKRQADFVEPCEIVVVIHITPEGKIKTPRVASSNGNAVMTDLTLGSVLEAKIPPIPQDLRQEMTSDTFEMSMDFVLY